MTVSIILSVVWVTLLAIHSTKGNRMQENDSQPPICNSFSVGDPVLKEFSSPNYPDSYPSSIRCTKLIRAPVGNRVMLEILGEIHVEKSPRCKSDRLEVRDGPEQNSPLLRKVCGNKNPRTLYSTGRYMWLEFSSDDTDEYEGFQATYDYVPIPSGDPVRDETECYDFSVGHPQQKELSSPNYPNPYLPNMNCSKLITADFGQRVMLEMMGTFHIEKSPKCKSDRLEVRDGPDQNSPLIRKVCGHTAPTTMYSTGQYMWLGFTSDDNEEYPGFKAIYDYVSFPEEDLRCYEFSVGRPDENEFTSPNHPYLYFPNTTCTKLLVAESGDNIKLEFTGNFHMEDSPDCEADSLEIRDGPYEHSPLIEKLCGSETPPRVYSTGKFMWLKFTSNGVTRENGFKATYSYF